MRVSVVIPAYNEAWHIAETINAARAALDAAKAYPYEIIVVDDSSTDSTADIAKEQGASVVHSGKRNIGATRNIGAAAALGEVLLFVDADTIINARAVGAMLKAMEEGAIGGGALVSWSGPAKLWAEIGLRTWNLLSRITRWAPGGFFFARRAAFEQVGGFDERYFATEELDLSRKLKRMGRMVILTERFATSPRKAHQFSRFEVLRFVLRFLLRPLKTLQNRDSLDIWYERRS